MFVLRDLISHFSGTVSMHLQQAEEATESQDGGSCSNSGEQRGGPCARAHLGRSAYGDRGAQPPCGPWVNAQAQV